MIHHILCPIIQAKVVTKIYTIEHLVYKITDTNKTLNITQNNGNIITEAATDNSNRNSNYPPKISNSIVLAHDRPYAEYGHICNNIIEWKIFHCFVLSFCKFSNK